MRRKYRNYQNCLWKYRKARGLKQREVAKILELRSTGMISRWENGVCLPETENLIDLAQLYRTSMDALVIDLVRESRVYILHREEDVLIGHQ